MEDRRETVNLSVPAKPAEAVKSVRVERDVMASQGVTVRVVEVAWLRNSFEVRSDLEGELARWDALTMRWTERNWQWGRWMTWATATRSVEARAAQCATR